MAYTWVGPAGGAWDNPANWTTSGSASHGTWPGQLENSETIVVPGDAVIAAPRSTQINGLLEVASGATLTLTGPGAVSVSAIDGRDAMQRGIVIVDGATLNGGRGATASNPNGDGEGIDLKGSIGPVIIRDGGTLITDTTTGFSSIQFVPTGSALVNTLTVTGGNFNHADAWSGVAITGYDGSARIAASSITPSAVGDAYLASSAPNGDGSWSVSISDQTIGQVIGAFPSITPAPGFDMGEIGVVVAQADEAGTRNWIAQLGCFLAGTAILAEAGEVPVEALEPGDRIVTLVNGARALKPVKWVGSRSMLVGATAQDDLYPVRIRAGAFADDVPRRDLLVTNEHCLFIEGRFVPARMLVNGRSVLIDRSFTAYSFHHVELEEHAVVLSEGLATESYLDTGNRANFIDENGPSVGGGAADSIPKIWERDAAAPLCVERAFVEPVWRDLERRAIERGIASVEPDAVLTDDAGLHLRTDTGLRIRPLHGENGRYLFHVPGGPRVVHIASRASRPSEVVGPFVDDRRRFGVKLGEIFLQDGDSRTPVTAHLSMPVLEGWLDPDTQGRWTNGDAMLPVGLGSEAVVIEIQVLAGGPYLINRRNAGGILALVA